MNSYMVFFDLDGTIVDSSPGVTECAFATLRCFGCDSIEREVLESSLIGPPLFEGLKNLTGREDEEISAMVEDFRRRYAEFGVTDNILYPKMYSTLEKLRSMGCILAVLTSKPQRFADIIIEQHKLNVFFKTVWGAAENEKKSSKSAKMAELITRFDLSAQNCVMVGDRMEDLTAAKENGVSSVAVLYGFGDARDLRTASTEVAEDAMSIVEKVGKIFGTQASRDNKSTC